MTQRHLDRLSTVDATFLHQEDGRDSHMHIGGLATFDGPPPSYQEFAGHIERRLHLVPRYRQKLVFPPLQAGRPLWIDDPSFNIDYHVRHTALPAPGDEEQLLRLVSRIVSQRLDRTKPLWELWLVEGLAGGRFGLITKTHHALVDGVSGVELMTALLDLSPETVDRGDGGGWHPEPSPSPVGLVARGLRDAVRRVAVAPAMATAAVADPMGMVNKLLSAAEGLGEVARAALNPAPATPLNVPPGPHRVYAVQRNSLADLKAIKNAFGGTVNDVVMSVVAGALARFLRERGMDTEDTTLRALVPVSTRSSAQGGALGNQLTVMLAPLPISISDPLERFHIVREAMDGIKESKQALGAQVMTAVQSFAPPTVLAQASRLAFSSRMYNLLITNVPGPQFAVYLAGRRMREAFPIAFLAAEHALAIAVLSYDGELNFGLLGDYDVLPDIEVLAGYLARSVSELLELARAKDGHDTDVSPELPELRVVGGGDAVGELTDMVELERDAGEDRQHHGHNGSNGHAPAKPAPSRRAASGAPPGRRAAAGRGANARASTTITRGRAGSEPTSDTTARRRPAAPKRGTPAAAPKPGGPAAQRRGGSAPKRTGRSPS